MLFFYCIFIILYKFKRIKSELIEIYLLRIKTTFSCQMKWKSNSVSRSYLSQDHAEFCENNYEHIRKEIKSNLERCHELNLPSSARISAATCAARKYLSKYILSPVIKNYYFQWQNMIGRWVKVMGWKKSYSKPCFV